jgi:hypothetical protein
MMELPCSGRRLATCGHHDEDAVAGLGALIGGVFVFDDQDRRVGRELDGPAHFLALLGEAFADNLALKVLNLLGDAFVAGVVVAFTDGDSDRFAGLRREIEFDEPGILPAKGKRGILEQGPGTSM